MFQEENEHFGDCTILNNRLYKAGIYQWGLEKRSTSNITVPFPEPLFVIPGMHIACMPYFAVIKSTLECLFSSSCVNITTQWLSSLQPDTWPKPLLESNLFTFKINDTIQSIGRKFFVDRWQIEVNFDNYYHTCDPIECTYSYIDYDRLVNLFTKTISFYGGLSVILRLIAPRLMKFFQKVNSIFKNRQSHVQPANSTTGNR